MDEEALARGIADLEREQHAGRDDLWEDVVYGRADADAVVEQRRAEGGDEEALALAAELMAPLSDAFEEALTDRLLQPEAQAEVPEETEAEDEDEDEDESAESAEVIDRSDRSWWARGGLMAVAGIVAAAALVIFLMPRNGGDGGEAAPAGITLPEHDMWLQPSSAAVRSVKDTTVEVVAGESLAVFWRPATSHTVAPQVWVCLEGQGPTRRLPVAVTPGKPGTTIEAKVTVPADLAAGPWTLVGFVDARPAPEDACSAAPSSARRVQRVPMSVVSR